MPITAEQFSTYYPRLFHMAEEGVWPSIKKHGLLSTAALLDLLEKNGELRRRIETEHRPESISIRHQTHGVAVIRDQKPMRERPLRQCLQGMTPQEWYAMLNGRVFFWVTEARVQTLLLAKAYRDRTHTVITVDTRRFFAKYANQILLSPINSGSTIYKPQPRGVQTFLPMAEYPFAERRKMRGIHNAVAEAVVTYAVPDLKDFTLRVEHCKGKKVLEVVYNRAR